MKLNLNREQAGKYKYSFGELNNVMFVEWSDGYFEPPAGEMLEPKDAVADLQKYQSDWLTLESAVQRQGELIEKLEKAVVDISEYRNGEELMCNICKEWDEHKKDCSIGLALAAASKWRKEQMK
jgi:hypothetical protein